MNLKTIKSKSKVYKACYSFLASALLSIALILPACTVPKNTEQTTKELYSPQIDAKKLSGGSSGMEQISDSSYIVVYDLKSHKQGARLGLITIGEESMSVLPIVIDVWDEEGLPNDLESICAVPGKANEFLVAEAGNWQGELGRIFHIQIDFGKRTAKVLTTLKYPFLHRNDFGIEGDQYEGMHCLPYTKNERIILLGERGGSEFSPSGVIRWGIWDMKKDVLTIEGAGLKGISVSAPGHWTNAKSKRSITDMYVDKNGTLWASASEDQGDAGPFYSVIYPLGKINPMNSNLPVTILDFMAVGREIYGLKIEALSGPKEGIQCTHTFGTEDEMYGGVFRPIKITSSR
jgi:hypothetical protein